MKSIKPGRGPSMLGGIGSVGAGIFGILWTIGAVSIGTPWYFPLFGVVFVGIAIVQAVYNFNNATNQNRFSQFDIVDESEEKDPLQEYITKQSNNNVENLQGECSPGHPMSIEFCPYCGNPVQEDFEYCNKCGKKLPA